MTRIIFPLTSLVLALLVGRLQAQDDEDIEPLARGPLHEAVGERLLARRAA